MKPHYLENGLVHIAAANLLPSPVFVSTDKRQLTAAKLTGLTTVNLTPRRA